MIYLAQRLGYINQKINNDLIDKSDEVQKLISGFIKSIKPKTNNITD